MAVYDVSKYVQSAIASARGQDLQDLEIIVADDGSTDGTADRAEEAADLRTRVLRLPHAGPVVTLNRGIAEARGRYVAFLDGDDLWEPTKLRTHVARMEEQPEIDLTFSLSRTIDAEGRDLHMPSRAWHGPLGFERLLVDNLVANGSAVVVRRSVLRAAGPLDTSLAAAHDFDLWLRIARQRPANILCIPEILTSYRRRPGQITRDWRLMQDCLTRVYERHRSHCENPSANLDREARCNLFRYLAALNYELGEGWTGLGLLARSFAAFPGMFLRTRRSYLVMAALLSRAVLPAAVCQAMEKAVRGC